MLICPGEEYKRILAKKMAKRYILGRLVKIVPGLMRDA
jgi:hypothetical protein